LDEHAVVVENLKALLGDFHLGLLGVRVAGKRGYCAKYLPKSIAFDDLEPFANCIYQEVSEMQKELDGDGSENEC
jgi:hypothetical protein